MYILDVLFNDPPPPPPPNAGEVEPNIEGQNLTVRQRLKQWFNRRLFYWSTTRFHRDLFSAAWDEQHEAVMRYFEGRDDLHVIDFAATPEADLVR